jgi:hypothetical protein
LRRTLGALALLTLLSAGAAATASSNPIPQGYSVAARSILYTGVEYSKLARSSPAVVAHVAHVVPNAPVDLRIVNAEDKLSTRPSDLETTSSMCGRVHCIVGVNGDFHINGAPAGGVITDGRMLQSPQPGRPQLTVTSNGHLVAGEFPWSGSLTLADGVQIPLASVNTPPPANGLALYTPAHGASTDVSTRTELLVKVRGGSLGALNQPTDVELRGVRVGGGPIPSDGAVLSGDAAAGQQLADAWARLQMGSRATLVVSSPVDAAASLGAYPVVLHGGQKAVPYGNDPNLINPRQPHTLVGWNAAGDVYLVAVDGRQVTSEGVSMDDAANFLLGLGATEAVNLDGGGGTTFVAGGAVWNRPSDPDPAHPGGFFERGATNAFVVMPRPGAPTPPPPPSKPPTTVSSDPLPDLTPAVPAPGSDGPPAAETPLGGGLFGPIGGIAGGSDPSDLPMGGSPGSIGVSRASVSPGGHKLGAAGSADGSDESAMGAPAGAPAAGGVDKVVGALTAPLAIASGLGSHLVEAAITGDPTGGLIPGARWGGIAAIAFAVTAVATRRRRRRRRRAGPAAS